MATSLSQVLRIHPEVGARCCLHGPSCGLHLSSVGCLDRARPRGNDRSQRPLEQSRVAGLIPLNLEWP